ncbi:MAG: sigma 54-interacting transcriptional regulator [Planctomycetes bacterium]|nr:sigma 54-interacting transcriptional regulator [Planctomycetota bacterium]
MKRKKLSEYLTQIKVALGKKDDFKVKRYGEIALKKISGLSFSPVEEYEFYDVLGSVYYNLSEFSKSLDMFYKAHLAALKHRFKPAEICYPLLRMAHNFLVIGNIKEAFEQFQKAEKYYQKYGDGVFPMTRVRYFTVLLGLGYCYLHKGELEKANEIVDTKIPEILQSLDYKFAPMDYNHLKGEYLMAVKEYHKAKDAFNECVKVGDQFNFPRGSLEAKTHLAAIEVMENNIDSASRILQRIINESKRLKLNDLVCEASLMLSKIYFIKNIPEKAMLVEKRIKPVLAKLDMIWLYEKTREFDRLYRQLDIKNDKNYSMAKTPEVLIDVLKQRQGLLPYRKVVIGNSVVMQDVYNLIEKIAPTDLPVLIQGETGTGKELVANIIHQNSLRANAHCLAFNSGALPETLIESHLFGYTKGAFTGAAGDSKGYIELASGGTLFVDEIANMPPSMQQKLLRILEEKLLWQLGAQKPIQINTRFIFASNQNIEQMVRQKLFREDLFYRINTIVINLPHLRNRKEDIPILVQHFLSKHSSAKISNLPVISPSAMQLLIAYPWPGNVRELENEIKRIYVLYPGNGEINESMLSEPIRRYKNGIGSSNAKTLKELTELYQKNIITEALQSFGGSVSQAARALGYDRVNLYRKMKQLKMISSKMLPK